MAAHSGGWDQVGSYWDFAAGHGRLTRWLLAERAGNRIWVSDVKPDAVRFHSSSSSASAGFVSVARPTADLRAPLLVRLRHRHVPVFAPARADVRASARPAPVARQPRGSLAFTTHPRGDNPDDFTFVPASEETMLANGVRHTLPVDDYGTTYVAEPYVAGALASLGVTRYEFRPLGLCGCQDLYLVTRP